MRVLKYKLPKTELCVFMMTFLLHLYWIFQLKGPQYADEYRTFLTGAFLSGKYDLSLLHSMNVADYYYGFGQTVFYVPFFYLFRSIDNVFKASLLFNAVIVSLIPVVVINIYRRLLNLTELQMGAVGFAIGIFPPIVYQSKTVTNETFLCFFPVLILFILVLLCENTDSRRRRIFSFILGTASMYMYTLNARGLAIFVAIFLCVVYSELIKRNHKISFMLYLSGSIIVYIVNKFVKHYIYIQYHQPLLNTNIKNDNINFIGRMKLLDLGKLLQALETYSGNLFYIMITTFGLIIVIVLTYFMKKKSMTEDMMMLLAMLNMIITCGMLFFINYNFYASPSESLIDYYIYGRYYDLFIPVILIVGIYLIVKFNYKPNFYIAVLFIFFTIIGITSFWFADVLVSTKSNGIRLLNIGFIASFLDKSFVQAPEPKHFLICGGIILFLSVLLIYLIKKKIILGSLLMCIVFCFITQNVMASSINTSASQYETLEKYRNLTDKYEELDDSYKSIYFLYKSGTQRGVNIQYALMNWRICQLDWTDENEYGINNIPENVFILTKNDDVLDIMLDNCTLLDNQGSFYLWAYGERLNEILKTEDKCRKQIDITNRFTNKSTLVIERNHTSFGPYIDLKKGSYEAVIKGSDLQNAGIHMTKEIGAEIIEHKIIVQTADLIKVQFELGQFSENVEILVGNTSDGYIFIDSLNVKNIEDDSLVYDKPGSKLRTTNENSYIAVTHNQFGEIDLIYLKAGSYLFNIKNAEPDTLLIESNSSLISVEDITDGNDSVTLRVSGSEDVKNLKLSLKAKTNVYAAISNICIEKESD